MFGFEYHRTKIDSLIPLKNDKMKFQNYILSYWTLFTDIFHFLQGKAMVDYPFVDMATFYEYFIRKLDLIKDEDMAGAKQLK